MQSAWTLRYLIMYLHLFPWTESLPVISCRGFRVECLECGRHHLLWISINTCIVSAGRVHALHTTQTPPPPPSPDTASRLNYVCSDPAFCCVYACLFVRLRCTYVHVVWMCLTMWFLRALICTIPPSVSLSLSASVYPCFSLWSHTSGLFTRFPSLLGP